MKIESPWSQLIAFQGGTMMNKYASHRRGFTLIEMLIAGLITSFVLGSLSLSLSQLTKAKTSTKSRLAAHLRANAALESIRQDIASVIRSPDLFWTRFLLEDDESTSALGALDRDSLLLFSTKLRPIHPVNFTGEGIEYETQYRIEDDSNGPVLWQRRDASPDEFPKGGGTATPIVEGIIALNFEVYDGQLWYEQWDSDIEGLPVAVRVTVTASGQALGTDAYDENIPVAIMRTVIAIDRVILPSDIPEEIELLDPELDGAQPGDASGNGSAVNAPGGLEGDGTSNNPQGNQNPSGGSGSSGNSTPGGGNTGSGSSTGNRDIGNSGSGNR